MNGKTIEMISTVSSVLVVSWIIEVIFVVEVTSTIDCIDSQYFPVYWIVWNDGHWHVGVLLETTQNPPFWHKLYVL